jgi:hypothetical protein
MSKAVKDGGPSSGMSLRDYFAAHALPEAMRYVDGFGVDDYADYRKRNKMRKRGSVEEIMAHLAYAQADAMLAARKL